MRIIIGILFFIVICYHLFHFVQLLRKMNGNVLFPRSEAEYALLRKFPDKPLASPTFQAQKIGIIFYSAMFLVGIIVLFFWLTFEEFNSWIIFLAILLPFAQAQDIFNLFAVVEEGLLVGSSFIPWNKIRSVQVKKIDVNHKYYGYSNEINDKGYEVIINNRFIPVSFVVISQEMKDQLIQQIQQYSEGNEKLPWKVVE